MAVGSASSRVIQSPQKYFRHTTVFWVVAVFIGQVIHGWAVFSPSTFPYKLLEPFGTIVRSFVEDQRLLIYVAFAIVWAIHIVEAFLVYKLCNAKGITDRATQHMWFLQTLLFGNASFIYLVTYKPPKKNQ